MAHLDYPFFNVDQRTKLLVWERGIIVPGYDPDIYRKDMCGNWMQRTEHGDEGDYGWEIDHVYPRSLGGLTTLDNLQPLWWRNNRRKGDTFPWFG